MNPDNITIETIIPTASWDDPLNYKLTGTITVEELDKVYTDTIFELNNKRLRNGNYIPLAAQIEKLYYIARLGCQRDRSY